MAADDLTAFLAQDPLAAHSAAPPAGAVSAPVSAPAKPPKTAKSKPAADSLTAFLSTDPLAVKDVPRGTPDDGSIIKGGLEGAWNTLQGLVTTPIAQGAALADIPVHAAVTKAGGKVPEPEDVQDKISSFLAFDPTEMKTAAAAHAVETAVGDVLGAPGNVLAATAKRFGKAPVGADTTTGANFQARFGIPVPGVTADNPEGIVDQSPYEAGVLQALGNAPATVMLGAKGDSVRPAQTPAEVQAASVPLEETPVPPPQAAKGGYKPPKVGETAQGQVERRAPGDLNAEIRAAYDQLTAAQKESVPLKDAQTGFFSRGMYDQLKASARPQAFMDLDGLSRYNTNHGYDAGDALINLFSQAAQTRGLPVFRVGGDEFSILNDGTPDFMARVRQLQQDFGATSVKVTLPDGTTADIPSGGFSYGIGRDKAAASAAAITQKAARKGFSLDEYTRQKTGGAAVPVPGEVPEGNDVPVGRGTAELAGAESASDLSRRLAGTGVTAHTPLDVIPEEYTLNKVRFHEGDKRDTIIPVKTLFEEPGDNTLFRIGDQLLQFNPDKEIRLNTANAKEMQLLTAMRKYLADEGPAWAQNDMRANLAYARDFARQVRDLHQRGYNEIRSHLEETHPGNERGELRANMGQYAFETRVPRYTPEDTIVKCF